MKKFLTNEHNSILFFVAVLLITAVFITAVSDIGCDKTAEDRAQLEKAVANAAVACYAVEGAYPPSVEYLTEYYGVQIDSERFTVKYDLYASNLMPDITVLVNNHED